MDLEKVKGFLPHLRECFIYSVIILAIDLVVFLVISFITPLVIRSFVPFLLLVESGIGLTLGGALDLVSSASVSKFLEQTSRSTNKEPWTIKKYKIRQITTNKVIITSGMVFLIGLIVSLFT